MQNVSNTPSSASFHPAHGHDHPVHGDNHPGQAFQAANMTGSDAPAPTTMPEEPISPQQAITDLVTQFVTDLFQLMSGLLGANNANPASTDPTGMEDQDADGIDSSDPTEMDDMDEMMAMDEAEATEMEPMNDLDVETESDDMMPQPELSQMPASRSPLEQILEIFTYLLMLLQQMILGGGAQQQSPVSTPSNDQGQSDSQNINF